MRRWPLRRPLTAEAIGAFIVSRTAANCTPRTIGWYKSMLRPLQPTKRLPTSTAELDELLSHIDGSDATKLGHWRAWRVFFAWSKENLGVANPMTRVKRPNQRKALPKALTDLQVDQLIAANAHDPRELAMICLMLDTGIRVGELASMNRDSIRLNGTDCTVQVTGKTGERELPIQDGTRQLLMKLPLHDNNLWTDRRGNRITTNACQHAIERAFRRAALKGHPHMLRHTFGKLYIRNGGDVFSLQQLMGHSSVETTMVYVQMNRADVAEQHAKFSPMARRYPSLTHAGKAVQPTPVTAGATS